MWYCDYKTAELQLRMHIVHFSSIDFTTISSKSISVLYTIILPELSTCTFNRVLHFMSASVYMSCPCGLYISMHSRQFSKDHVVVIEHSVEVAHGWFHWMELKRTILSDWLIKQCELPSQPVYYGANTACTCISQCTPNLHLLALVMHKYVLYTTPLNRAKKYKSNST